MGDTGPDDDLLHTWHCNFPLVPGSSLVWHLPGHTSSQPDVTIPVYRMRFMTIREPPGTDIVSAMILSSPSSVSIVTGEGSELAFINSNLGSR